jgi:hypothetical protein
LAKARHLDLLAAVTLRTTFTSRDHSSGLSFAGSYDEHDQPSPKG